MWHEITLVVHWDADENNETYKRLIEVDRIRKTQWFVTSYDFYVKLSMTPIGIMDNLLMDIKQIFRNEWQIYIHDDWCWYSFESPKLIPVKDITVNHFDYYKTPN
jgi:hypothetical protein